MTPGPVSVVIVSRGRPDALSRCLTGLSQQYYPNFEVIVVTDPESAEAVTSGAFSDSIKVVTFDEANISKARNLGIASAAGEVVAFIDDDAVPEPTWLTHLISPFDSDAEVMATGGFVRGRNGISYQWKAQSIDATGRAEALEIDDRRPIVLHPTARRGIKTEGTNMAVRRDILVDMGGFDPSFHYYLDETDLNLRLAAMNHPTAIVPLAEVHHGYLPNATRRINRAPRDLFEIGASMGVFLRKHCPADQHASTWNGFVRMQRRRCLEFMRDGLLEPGEVRRLLAGLSRGYEAGQNRLIGALPRIPRSAEGFLPYPSRSGTRPTVISGRSWNARNLRRKAAEAASKGQNVSLFLFSPTSFFHRVRFCEDGYWEQKGGLFGRSERSQPLFRLRSFQSRFRAEKLRVAEQRRLFAE